MYKDYQEAIVRYFHYQLSKKKIENNLLDPTPANVKQECLNRAESGVTPKDIGALRSFFGRTITAENAAERINSRKPDFYKTVTNMLIGETRNPTNKNYELLGWLIDFPHRPYDSTFVYDEVCKGFKANFEKTIIPPPTPPKSSIWSRIQELLKSRIGLAGVGVIAVGSWMFFAGKTFGVQDQNNRVFQAEKPTATTAKSGTVCLIWTGFEYSTTDCDKPNAIVEGPNDKREMKLITRPDTITEASINKVGFITIKFKPEFYTTTGTHPIHRDRFVRRLSRLIYEKEILPLKGQ